MLFCLLNWNIIQSMIITKRAKVEDSEQASKCSQNHILDNLILVNNIYSIAQSHIS